MKYLLVIVPKGQQGSLFPSGNENGECVGGIQESAAYSVAAVVSITFNRADYLRRHVDSLLAVHEANPQNRCQSALAALS